MGRAVEQARPFAIFLAQARKWKAFEPSQRVVEGDHHACKLSLTTAAAVLSVWKHRRIRPLGLAIMEGDDAWSG